MATPTREDQLLEAKFKIIQDSIQIALSNFGFFDQKTVKNSKYLNVISQVDDLEALMLKAKHLAIRIKSNIH